MEKEEFINEEATEQVAENEPTNQNPEPITKLGEVTGEKEQKKEILKLQAKAAKALNELWDKLREQNYRAYSVIDLLGLSFIYKRDEEENIYFAPRDISDSEYFKRHEEEEEEKEEREGASIIPDRSGKIPTRNVTTNGGKFRSVQTSRNDNTPHIG